MNTLLRIAVFVLAGILAPAAAAQSLRSEMLALVPDDFAVCVVMHDLRGQAQRWEKSAWLKTARQSPLGKAVLEGPELKKLRHWEKELKKNFDLDWPTLRDDILGDNVVLSYSSGREGKPEDERGLILVQPRKPERLQKLIDQLNQLQKQSGELKALTALQHQGQTYYRRVQGSKTHYYLLDGPLFAFSSREELIQNVIAKKPRWKKEHVWATRFKKAGADHAFLTLAVNPRAIEPDFLKKKDKDERLPGYWQALEGIFLTLSIEDQAEVRLAIQARPEALPKWFQPAFTDTPDPSALWHHFPEPSILTVAAKTDFSGLVEALRLLMPEKDRKELAAQLRSLGALLGQDILGDVVPNLGPDWGVCVLPARNAEQMPAVLAALAVKPGAKDPPVDRTLFEKIEQFSNFALFGYNTKQSEPIRLQSVMQDKVKVIYLSNDKLFPPGVEPACALKEGYLLFASAPEVIAQFRPRPPKSPPGPDTPLLALSARELAKLIRQRQGAILVNLQERQHLPEADARKNVQSVLALLDLFERVTLSQEANAGQASWTLRITPVSP